MQALLFSLLLVKAIAATPLQDRAPSGGYPASNTRGPVPKNEWVATYNAAKAAGKIPAFAPAFLNGAGVPQYAADVETGENGVCSWTMAHCFGDNDVYEAPDGMYGISFDDGPLPASPTLYNFLQQNNQTATHFFIGSNVMNSHDVFQQAVQSGGHIGVHTWSHPYMTTLTDMEILGELGWTAQIIYDWSGFAPKWWRPPYGDTDDRVRAIATEVFGLTLAGWDVDSFDWCLSEGGGSSCVGQGPASQQDLEGEVRGWQAGSKSPGVLGLEHELTSHSVAGFINTFPGIKQHGWDAHCIPDLFGHDWYLNAPRNGAADPSVQIGVGSYAATAPSSNSTSSSASSSTSTSTTSSASSAPSGFSSVSTSKTATIQSQQAPSASTTAHSSGGSGINAFTPVLSGTVHLLTAILVLLS
ncbi:hypothetical protein JCM11641_005118 [Rhodosporidiobolus odoratus]